MKVTFKDLKLVTCTNAPVTFDSAAKAGFVERVVLVVMVLVVVMIDGGVEILTVYAKLAVDRLAQHHGHSLATVVIFHVSLSHLEPLILNALALCAVQPGVVLAFLRWSALRWIFVALGEGHPLLDILCHFNIND